MNQSAPLTYLFVPGNRPERFDKAIASGADAVIIDFEDAVAPEEKNAARIAFTQWFAARDEDRSRVVIRINDAASVWYRDDVAVAKNASVATVMLPKCESAAQVTTLVAALDTDAKIIALVETAKGVLAVREIARTNGVVRIAFGSIDFSVDMDLPNAAPALDHVSVDIALASRAANIAPPIAGVTTAMDSAIVEADMRWAAGLGFAAKLCIHPSQLAAVRTAMLPSADDIAWAQRVIAAASPGFGAIKVDGRMVDRPVILRAERILSRR